MKKVFSIIILCALLACTVLEIAVSADGAVLWTEDFSTQKENDWIWDAGTTNFFIEKGKLEGWAEAVVHQSNFLVDRGAPRRYKECAFKVECAGLEDGGRDAEEHSMSIWLADYISPSGDPEATDGTITYMCGYNFEQKCFTVSIGFDGDAESFKPADYPAEGPLYKIPVDASEAPVLDSAGKSTFTLGMRAYKGKVGFYMNDKKLAEINAYRGATSFTQVGSPILLFNNQLHCTFDNLVVATGDYNLFNESNEPQTEKVIETKIVHDTDEEGNDVTVIVTEEVVREVAQTGGTVTSGTASATGDSAIIVIAVMVVALGAAIVVKKVSSK